MMSIRNGRKFHIIAFLPYKFYLDESGVCVRNEDGEEIGRFATEEEAVEYMKLNRKELGLEGCAQ